MRQNQQQQHRFHKSNIEREFTTTELTSHNDRLFQQQQQHYMQNDARDDDQHVGCQQQQHQRSQRSLLKSEFIYRDQKVTQESVSPFPSSAKHLDRFETTKRQEVQNENIKDSFGVGGFDNQPTQSIFDSSTLLDLERVPFIPENEGLHFPESVSVSSNVSMNTDDKPYGDSLTVKLTEPSADFKMRQCSVISVQSVLESREDAGRNFQLRYDSLSSKLNELSRGQAGVSQGALVYSGDNAAFPVTPDPSSSKLETTKTEEEKRMENDRLNSSAKHSSQFNHLRFTPTLTSLNTPTIGRPPYCYPHHHSTGPPAAHNHHHHHLYLQTGYYSPAAASFYRHNHHYHPSYQHHGRYAHPYLPPHHLNPHDYAPIQISSHRKLGRPVVQALPLMGENTSGGLGNGGSDRSLLTSVASSATDAAVDFGFRVGCEYNFCYPQQFNCQALPLNYIPYPARDDVPPPPPPYYSHHHHHPQNLYHHHPFSQSLYQCPQLHPNVSDAAAQTGNASTPQAEVDSTLVDDAFETNSAEKSFSGLERTEENGSVNL